MPDKRKDSFLPSLSDQSSYCYLGNTKHPYHIQEMFCNIFGVTDQSINTGILILPRHKELFSNFLCQQLLHCNLEEISQKTKSFILNQWSFLR